MVALVALVVIVGAVLVHLSMGNRLPEHFVAFLFALNLWLYDSIDLSHMSLGRALALPARALAQPLLALGLISYSVYLVHFNLHKLPRMVLERVIPADSIGLDLLVILSTCLLCVPFYLICEKPFVSMRSKGRAAV
jgi:peptidoglycan/LPS O-acetylase OafA/YrhL